MAAGHLFGRFPSGLIAVPCVSREDGDRQKIRLKTAATVDQTKEFFFFFLQLLRLLHGRGGAFLSPLLKTSQRDRNDVIGDDVRGCELRHPG